MVGQTALDLFAGAGGWSVACQRLGIDEVGVENMPAALETRAAAGFKSHETGDVWDFPFHEHRGQFDGLIASPPCQTFSTAGRGAGRKALDQVQNLIIAGVWKDKVDLREAAVELGDERTALVLTPLHAAWELRPEWVCWEQVPTVLPVWEACAVVLRSMGYSVWTGNLQAEMYGVPQTRKRAFLIAHREREVAPPVPTHSRYYSRNPEKLDEGVRKWVSMAEALGWAGKTYYAAGVTGAVDRDVSAPANTFTGKGTAYLRSNYGTGGDAANRGERAETEPAATITSKVDRNKWVYRANKMANGAWREATDPAPTVAFGHDAASVRWFQGRPAPTVVGTRRSEGGMLIGRQLADPCDSRSTGGRDGSVGLRVGQLEGVRVTVEEAGVLQSFPADFPWRGVKTKQYLQCGNAVPPLLAEAVLRAVVRE